jgi:hypothetical protein
MYVVIGQIQETHALPVSARGDGLCLYLPKAFCELHGIIAGDRLKVQIRDHYRQKPEESNSFKNLLRHRR